MSIEGHWTRRAFLKSAVSLSLYVWILTSSVSCIFRRSPESPSVEEVTPTPATVEPTPKSQLANLSPAPSRGILLKQSTIGR